MVKYPWAEPAFGFDDDPKERADQLRPIHTSAVRQGAHGRATGPRPRPVIEASWQRVRKAGVRQGAPDPQINPDSVPEAFDGIQETHAIDAKALIDFITHAFAPALANSQLVGVLALEGSNVAMRFGNRSAIAHADSIGMVPGALWSETGVGTNAIGITALTGRPTQVHGPEHWCVDQHDWSCSAAPVRNPATGRPIAVLDVSGPVSQSHPAVLGLVQSVASQVELMMEVEHRRRLDALRVKVLPQFQHSGGPLILCDRNGWVLGAFGVEVPDKLDLDAVNDEAVHLVPGIGPASLTVNDDVVVVVPLEQAVSRAEYVLNPVTNELRFVDNNGESVFSLSPRHCAILLCLIHATSPVDVQDIAREVWRSAEVSSVTVRAEMSRLRKRFPHLVSEAPYRVLSTVHIG